MADLSLKGLDDVLMTKVRVCAVGSGMTLRAFVIRVLEVAVWDGKIPTEAENGDVRPTRSHFQKAPIQGRPVQEVRSGSDDGEQVARFEEGSKPRGSGRSETDVRGIKKLTTDEYLKLSNSDKMRATREGRY